MHSQLAAAPIVGACSAGASDIQLASTPPRPGGHTLLSFLPLQLTRLREMFVGARKKRILILISDTGGGHRASAQVCGVARGVHRERRGAAQSPRPRPRVPQALADLIAQYHGDRIEVSIVDVWTSYTPWPFNKMVRQYRYMAQRPQLWKAMYTASAFAPTRKFFNGMQRVFATSGIRACLEEHDPDLVISMHPLCQTVPLQALAAIAKAKAAKAGGKAGAAPQVPFVTVVTDLGTAHPLWLHPGADLCFVPSAAFLRAAKQKGLREHQLRFYGLPVHRDFTQQRRRGAAARRELGLLPDRKTVLIVGGGDGVGRLAAIATAVGEKLGRSGEPMQLVAVCGRNARLERQLREQAWPPSLHVEVEGFVTRMAEYMAAADCLVTKAGPGTIAEAAICGLPVMLSGHLPGQETGNIKHVLQNGFGAYSKNPRIIAQTVARWLSEPLTLETLSRNARAAGMPGATYEIVHDVVELLERESGRKSR